MAGATLAGEPRTDVDLGGRSACAMGGASGVEVCGIDFATAWVLGGVTGVTGDAAAAGAALGVGAGTEAPTAVGPLREPALAGMGGTGGCCSAFLTVFTVAVEGLLEKRRRIVPKKPSFFFSYLRESIDGAARTG